MDENNKGFRKLTVDAIIIEGDKILLIKRSKEVTQGGKYALPGGHVDSDETIRNAIVREVKEETGYESKIKKLCFIADDPLRANQSVTLVFLITPIAKTGKNDWEVDSVEWFELDNLPKKDEVAFDHYQLIKKYITCLKNKTSFPQFISNLN